MCLANRDVRPRTLRLRGVLDVLRDATNEDLPFFRKKVERVRIAIEGVSDDVALQVVKALQDGTRAS